MVGLGSGSLMVQKLQNSTNSNWISKDQESKEHIVVEEEKVNSKVVQPVAPLVPHQIPFLLLERFDDVKIN